MNQLKIALEKILNMKVEEYSAREFRDYYFEAKIIAQQALSTEVTEPRKFSEIEQFIMWMETTHRASNDERYKTALKEAIYAARLMFDLNKPSERMYSEGQMRVDMLRVVKEFSKPPIEGRMSFSELMNDVIQSLSPKEGKEKVRTYTYRELEWFGIDLMSGDYIHTITNNKELVEHCKKQAQAFTDYESLEPNQTEAEKVIEKYFPNPDDLVNGRVKGVIVKAMEEYASLARKQVIEEIEGWMNELKKNSTEPITHLAIPYTILLTKLSKLK